VTDKELIRGAMARLPASHRAMIYRAHYLGQSIAQIAAELDTPERVVRAELHEAMTELRKRLVDLSIAV
jgi:RNA polymerase sigma-70 factor, ECF subfamily